MTGYQKDIYFPRGGYWAHQRSVAGTEECPLGEILCNRSQDHVRRPGPESFQTPPKLAVIVDARRPAQHVLRKWLDFRNIALVEGYLAELRSPILDGA